MSDFDISSAETGFWSAITLAKATARELGWDEDIFVKKLDENIAVIRQM